MVMDIRKIKKLIELLQESDLAEMEICEADESIRLSRYSSSIPAPTPYAVPASLQQMPMGSAMLGVPDAAASKLPPGHEVKSPMVGTYYDSSGPESDPFVKVGDSVSMGDTLCIIEAMKIFNQIEADKSGIIKAVMKSTNDPVEYDECLFVIE